MEDMGSSPPPVTRSTWPSPSRSMSRGRMVVIPSAEGGRNVPSPLPRSNASSPTGQPPEYVPLGRTATTSTLPSSSTSRASSPSSSSSKYRVGGFLKLPSPFPRNNRFPITRSALPSPLTSATAYPLSAPQPPVPPPPRIHPSVPLRKTSSRPSPVTTMSSIPSALISTRSEDHASKISPRGTRRASPPGWTVTVHGPDSRPQSCCPKLTRSRSPSPSMSANVSAHWFRTEPGPDSAGGRSFRPFGAAASGP